MSKKELNAWDRFWLSVKANEKVIWVLLLVVIAPTFAFPVASTMFTGSGTDTGTVATVFGKNVKASELNLTQKSLQRVQALRPTRFRPSGVLEYMVYCEEADRLGIRVSDLELGAQIRQVYWNLVAREAAVEAALKAPEDKKGDPRSGREEIFYQVYTSKRRELEEKNVFGDREQRDWYVKLQNVSAQFYGPIDRANFEETLRQVMKAEKLEEYVRSSVQVTPQEELEEFKKSEQSRKFSFFEVRADEGKAEIEKAVTDADLKAHYEKNRESFREPLKVSAEYLSLPIAAFEKDVTLTDEDLRKEYDRVKLQKYQTFVGGPVEGGFELPTPEERAARDQKAFRPFEEVKEEVRAELLKTRTREAARAAAEKVRERLYPPDLGAITEKGKDGEKETGKNDEKVPPTPATFAEVAKDYPMAKAGATPWVERKDAEKTLGPEVYSFQISSWFTQAEGSSREKATKKLEAQKSYTPAPASDAKYFIFYRNPQVRPAGVPKLAEARDKVLESLVKEKLLDRAREKARALADAVKEGKKSFEEAAGEAGHPVVTSAFVTRTGAIRVPLTPEEMKKAEAEKTDAEKAAEKARREALGEDAEPAPKDREHPGSLAIIDYGFKALHEKGKVDGFAEDPRNAACYVVRWDDVIYPDLTQFEKKRPSIQRRLLMEKQELYLDDWQKKLNKRAGIQVKADGEDSPEA